MLQLPFCIVEFASVTLASVSTFLREDGFGRGLGAGLGVDLVGRGDSWLELSAVVCFPTGDAEGGAPSPPLSLYNVE